ncbi:hypothetical protein [Mycolicibacterium sp. P1-5]|uniref:hypothetical protein n=1 Tax=Mycolicibacterium sp. P1-5 TaxID=2024617 RepID=UPI0011EF890C|nr:hypothetical protein [Mycolicibacterium sp. P1-5]
MLGGVAATGAGAVLVQKATARDAATPRNTRSAFGIDILDYIRNPADATTHTAGFKAAIAAAIAGDGDEIVIPAGKWYVEGLSIPRRASLKFRGAGSTAFSWLSPDGDTTGTQLIRTGDRPIFSAIGPASVESGHPYGDVLDVFSSFVRDFVLEDMTLHNANENATTPLVDMKACSGGNFSRVVWYSPPGSSLISLQSVFDTRFSNCFFSGGGLEATGLGAVRILGQVTNGDGTSYRESKELQFVNCHSESYYGPAYEIGDSASTLVKPALMLFSNIKMESQLTTGPHIMVGAGSSIMTSNMYVSHWKTPGPVVDLQKCSGFYGNVSFNQIFKEGWVDPSCRLNVSKNATLVNLNVNLLSGPASTVNVVTIANPADPQNNITISGASQRANGANGLTKYHRNGIVRQRVTGDTANCEYIFSKGDLIGWSLGNPANPSGSLQEFSIRGADASGNVGTFITLRADGPNPATSARAAVFGAAVLLESAGANAYINFPHQLEPPRRYSGVQVYATDDGSGHLQLVLRNQSGSASAVVTRDMVTYTTTETLGAAPQTDYIALLDYGAAISLPTAEGNGNKYTLKNLTTEDMEVATTASQTVEGMVGITLSAGASINLVSDGSNWRII